MQNDLGCCNSNNFFPREGGEGGILYVDHKILVGRANGSHNYCRDAWFVVLACLILFSSFDNLTYTCCYHF